MTYDELLDKWIRKLGRDCTAGEVVYDLRHMEQPVRHGRWYSVENYMDTSLTMYVCSECGSMSNRKDNYCWNCGARMSEPTQKAVGNALETLDEKNTVCVVRCKDCIHWSYANEECIYHDFEDHPYGYCAWGERREDG